jgi:hypothetical protein
MYQSVPQAMPSFVYAIKQCLILFSLVLGQAGQNWHSLQKESAQQLSLARKAESLHCPCIPGVTGAYPVLARPLPPCQTPATLWVCVCVNVVALVGWLCCHQAFVSLSFVFRLVFSFPDLIREADGNIASEHGLLGKAAGEDLRAVQRGGALDEGEDSLVCVCACLFCSACDTISYTFLSTCLF